MQSELEQLTALIEKTIFHTMHPMLISLTVLEARKIAEKDQLILPYLSQYPRKLPEWGGILYKLIESKLEFGRAVDVRTAGVDVVHSFEFTPYKMPHKSGGFLTNHSMLLAIAFREERFLQSLAELGFVMDSNLSGSPTTITHMTQAFGEGDGNIAETYPFSLNFKGKIFSDQLEAMTKSAHVSGQIDGVDVDFLVIDKQKEV